MTDSFVWTMVAKYSEVVRLDRKRLVRKGELFLLRSGKTGDSVSETVSQGLYGKL